MSNNNLFLNTARLAQGPREDHLTEFLASALATSAPLRARYAATVLSAHAAAQGWSEPEIVDVRSQFSDAPGMRPDMVLELRGGTLIACEHKLDAPETTRPVLTVPSAPAESSAEPGDETEEQGQLWRYLNSPNPEFAGLLYIRQSPRLIEPRVSSHPHYIRPAGGRYEHFLWRDIYPALADNDNPLVRWLREGFERRGWVPLHPFFGDLDSKDAQEIFGTYWRAAETTAGRLGWRMGRHDFRMGITLLHPSAVTKQIAIVPRAQGDGRFRIRLTPRQPEDIGEVERRWRGIQAVIDPEGEVKRSRPGRVGAERPADVSTALERVDVIDVMTTLDRVFGDVHEGDAVERRLDEIIRALCTAMTDPATAEALSDIPNPE